MNTIRLLSLLLLPLANAQYPHEIKVTDRVMVQRAILGEPSSRLIAVGHPGGFNYAFDAVDCAPAFVWTGGFLNFAGEAVARGGRTCQVLGVKRPLLESTAPLRIGFPTKRPDALRFRGYDRDAETGAPTFRFEVDGTPVELNVDSPATNVIHLAFRFPDGLSKPAFLHLDPGDHQAIDLGESLGWHRPKIVKLAGPSDTETTGSLAITLTPSKKKFVRKAPSLSGEKLFKTFCNACHSTDGSKLIGPTFKGLWGREQLITRDGKTETIQTDEAYLMESIVAPQAAIVKGYELVPMADFSSVLTEEQRRRLVQYMKGMK